MNRIIEELEKEQLKKDVPRFKVGDTVRVAVRVEEGGKTRTQNFEGTVIKRKGSGIRSSFTVRRISFGEGVERNFPVHSPSVQTIEVLRRGKVRRAKLFYLRESKGKRGKIEQERREEQETVSE